jgi:hypothetical protein
MPKTLPMVDMSAPVCCAPAMAIWRVSVTESRAVQQTASVKVTNSNGFVTFVFGVTTV